MVIVKGQVWKVWEGMEVLFTFRSMGIWFQHKSCSCFILAFCTVFQQEKGTGWSTGILCSVSWPLLRCQVRRDLQNAPWQAGESDFRHLASSRMFGCIPIPSQHCTKPSSLQKWMRNSSWLKASARSECEHPAECTQILSEAQQSLKELCIVQTNCQMSLDSATCPNTKEPSVYSTLHMTFLLPLFSFKLSLFWPTFKIPNESQLSTELNMQPSTSMQMKRHPCTAWEQVYGNRIIWKWKGTHSEHSHHLSRFIGLGSSLSYGGFSPRSFQVGLEEDLSQKSKEKPVPRFKTALLFLLP